jgi:hypothetical protein
MLNRDGRLLAITSNQQTARVLDVASGQERARVGHDDAVFASAPNFYDSAGKRSADRWVLGWSSPDPPKGAGAFPATTALVAPADDRPTARWIGGFSQPIPL